MPPSQREVARAQRETEGVIYKYYTIQIPSFLYAFPRWGRWLAHSARRKEFFLVP